MDKYIIAEDTLNRAFVMLDGERRRSRAQARRMQIRNDMERAAVYEERANHIDRLLDELASLEEVE